MLQATKSGKGDYFSRPVPTTDPRRRREEEESSKMKMKISVSFEFEMPEGVTKLVQQEEIISLERDDFQLETLGLSLSEAKEVLAKLQAGLVKQQVDQYLVTQKSCPACGVAYFQKRHGRPMS